MDQSQLLAAACRRHGLAAVYRFGSRADDGRRVLTGDAVSAAGMRRAAELLPIERELERDMFGVSTA